MNGGGVRRVGVVLVAYVAGAWLVLGVAGWVGPALALPDLFPRLLMRGLALGLLLALVLAWHYPRIGHHGRPPREHDGEGS